MSSLWEYMHPFTCKGPSLDPGLLGLYLSLKPRLQLSPSFLLQPTLTGPKRLSSAQPLGKAPKGFLLTLGSGFSDSMCAAADRLWSWECAFHVCQDLWRAELPLVILRCVPLLFCSPLGVLQDLQDPPQAGDVQVTSIVR